MRITMVLMSDRNGGLEKHVRELSHQLVAQGESVSVIAPAGFLATLNKSVAQFEVNGKRSRYHPLALWQLWRQIKKANGDVIHAQANKAADMVGKLKPLVTVPIVATLHNMKSKLHAFNAYSHVITVSKQLSQAFSPRKEAHVVYNGIHKPHPKPIDLNQCFNLPSQPVICAVGRLVKAKGFDVLLAAVDGLAVNVIIIGEGDETEALKQQAKQLQAPTAVKFVGYREQVQDIIASSDGLVIASRREGFSYVLNEALACQVKVLSTDVPIANEVLPDTLIVPVNEVSALRAKLTKCLAAPAQWEAQMQAAWGFAAQSLTCLKMAANTAQVYRTLLQKQAN